MICRDWGCNCYFNFDSLVGQKKFIIIPFCVKNSLPINFFITDLFISETVRKLIMEEFKNMTVWELLNFLKIRVKSNVIVINENVEKLNLLKGRVGLNSENMEKIKTLTKENVDFSAENNKMFLLFNDLVKVYSNYFSALPNEKTDVNYQMEANFKSEKELFTYYIEKTICGEISLDERHPLKSDQKFLDNLFARCLENEQYEKCAAIKQLKDGKHS
jgi:hypothetical protein